MLRVLFDEDFDRRITNAVRDRCHGLDGPTVQELGIAGTLDPQVLAFAAAENRVIVSHDVNTMTAEIRVRINASEPVTGLIVVSRFMTIGDAAEQVGMAVQILSLADFEYDPIVYVPLR